MTRPISADVPSVNPAPSPQKRRRPVPAALKAIAGVLLLGVVWIVAAGAGGAGGGGRPWPDALKAIAGLFLLAVVFIVAAIVGGSGGGESPQAPGPVTESPACVEEPGAQTPEELGYPAFATANTTRVGGSDPASNAAAVALAAYPSGEQRPQAVTLVDGNDWRSAVSAAVLMAPPLGAPLLVSTAAGPPEPTEGALEALDPEGGG